MDTEALLFKIYDLLSICYSEGNPQPQKHVLENKKY